MDILRQDGWKARICGKIRGAPCSWQRSSDMNHSCDKLQKLGWGLGLRQVYEGSTTGDPCVRQHALLAPGRGGASHVLFALIYVIYHPHYNTRWRGERCGPWHRQTQETTRRALWAMAQANSGDHAVRSLFEVKEVIGGAGQSSGKAELISIQAIFIMEKEKGMERMGGAESR
jgi:hypothetical protein